MTEAKKEEYVFLGKEEATNIVAEILENRS